MKMHTVYVYIIHLNNYLKICTDNIDFVNSD